MLGECSQIIYILNVCQMNIDPSHANKSCPQIYACLLFLICSFFVHECLAEIVNDRSKNISFPGGNGPSSLK